MLDRLRAAIERLLEEGEAYTEIGVDRILAEAGIPRSTFYVYFADRSEMLRELFHESQRRLGAATRPWWQLGPGAERADVHRVMDGLVRAYRPHTLLMAAVHDAAAYDPLVRELVDELIDASIDDAREHIERGQREGFVNPALPPRPTAAWLVHMCERALHRFVRTADEPDVAGSVEALTEIVWQTLYAPARG